MPGIMDKLGNIRQRASSDDGPLGLGVMKKIRARTGQVGGEGGGGPLGLLKR